VQDARPEVEKALAQWDNTPLIALWCNAGIGLTNIAELSTEDKWKYGMQSNFFGQVECVRVFTPLLHASSKRGFVARIVFTASISADTPNPYFSIYCCSKAAVRMYADCLRQELAPMRIEVVTLMLGGFQSAIFDHFRANRAAEPQYDPTRRPLYPSIIPSPDELLPPPTPVEALVPSIAGIFSCRFPWNEYYLGTRSLPFYVLLKFVPRTALVQFSFQMLLRFPKNKEFAQELAKSRLLAGKKDD